LQNDLTRSFANCYYYGKNVNNIGDHIQLLTVDYLYKQIGVPKNEITRISMSDLMTYDGEPVCLPISFNLIASNEHGISGMFSNRITPVFLGITILKDSLYSEEVEYLKMHEPIGCRDERTWKTMSKYGISAYIGGCLTVTLPKREYDSKKHTTTFIIDPPKKVKPFIPEKIKKRAIYDTHFYYGNVSDPSQIATERYEKYRDEANLIITSLLHCAVPCLAYGIPVIIVRDKLSYRFGWLEALQKIYTTPEYSEINWNPDYTEFEAHKGLVKRLFSKRINDEDASKEISKLHNFYMTRKRSNYSVDVLSDIQEFIDRTWIDHEKAYEYAVWGLTHISEMTIDYISKRYVNAKLSHVYDIRPGLILNGIESISPENIAGYPEEIVFVTSVSATSMAKDVFQRIKKPEGYYFYQEFQDTF